MVVTCGFLKKVHPGYLALFVAWVTSTPLLAQQVSVKEVTNHYIIKGRTTGEFAASMSKNGPYSRQHKRRAWATAARKMTYQLERRRTAKGCEVKGAKVALKIDYTLPRLANTPKVSPGQRRKWQLMYGLLMKHEKVHGKLYKQFASEVRRDLLRMKPAKSCRELSRKASKIVDRLSEKDSIRNDQFDQRDRRNYRRMERLYTSG